MLEYYTELIYTGKCMNITKLSLILLFFSNAVFGNTIWSGDNVDLNISWTSEDIVATQAGKITFSAKELAKQDFEADFKVEDNTTNNCNYEREFILLSVVGNIASFQEVESVNCDSTPNPSIIIKFVTRDLTSGNKVELTDFFSESDLVKALKNDNLIKAALTKTDPTISTEKISNIVSNLRNKNISKTTNPNRIMLNGLYNALEWSEIIVKGCGYRLAKNFLNQFAFHHLNRGRVAVRLNLLPNSSACQTKNIQLGFYLPIPTSMKMALKHAEQKKTGFLMAKAMKGQTKISFTTKRVIVKPKQDTPITKSIVAKPAKPKILAQQTIELVNPHSEITIFTVRSGHTLYNIGKRFNCSVNDIANWNNLQRPYKIYIGQKLKLITDKISQHKVITASGINVRSTPKLERGNVVGQLQFGTAVKQLSRTRNPEKAGRFYNYWYKIETNDGKIGWLFGQYLSEFIPVQPEKRAKFYFQIAKKRAKKKLDLPNQNNLVNFFTTITDYVQVSPERATKLAMLHLRALTELIIMSKENMAESFDKTIKFIQSTQQSKILDDNKSLPKELAKLKIAVSNTDQVKKDILIKQIEQWQ